MVDANWGPHIHEIYVFSKTHSSSEVNKITNHAYEVCADRYKHI